MKPFVHIVHIPFLLERHAEFRLRLLSVLKEEPVFALLDSNDYYQGKDLSQRPYYHSYDLLAGIGVKRMIRENAPHAFERLDNFLKQNQTWLFGYLGYDLKNELEVLSSRNEDPLKMPELFFFEPEILITLKDEMLSISSDSAEKTEAFREKLESALSYVPSATPSNIQLLRRSMKGSYLENVEAIRHHIEEGDVYELNFCQEFYARKAVIDPFSLFININKLSPQPFSAFLHFEGYYVISASMERFLKKEGQKLISQPIKGTIRRGKEEAEDHQLMEQLRNDEKERAENVMIVDLVRNDLARSSIPGSVKVEELFGIYPFPIVHQMISTVTSSLRPGQSGLDAIKAAFPMGSMTGAPKIMSMHLIEQYEKVKRGIYSGAIGYFNPEGDFDFNVVIRTLVYDAIQKYISLQVGSAITYDSVPEKEYDECLVKIKGWLEALQTHIS